MKAEEALKWVAEVFEEPAEKIAPDTPKDAIPGWDSMGTLALMASLDKDFDIVLSTDELEELKRVSDILQVLRRNGKLEQEVA